MGGCGRRRFANNIPSFNDKLGTMAAPIESIQNFLQISPGLFTAGQPFRDQFAAVKEAGCAAVINLATPVSWDAVADEPELWQALGIEYVNIPVLWDAPQADDLRQFMDQMDRLQGQKVFVHCARNMRVSAFVFLYRTLRRGENPAACLNDLLKIWQPDETWQSFILTAARNFS
jgi:protein tyrosine phosphatase (PTP) superfamily phosphohydrolase (DUF442 family)